ncbi:alpha/beta fold hydrolase [Streptomyces sp. NPDC090741]|uniref:alpha/beta fold hydrolase n=1 Tax=Streptomyces sp. NPDC090741 TaxID=3365967 RepID=UPI003823FFB1
MSGGGQVLAGAVTVVATLALAACGGPAATKATATPTATPTATVSPGGTSGDPSHLVPMGGGGRRIRLECRGTGSPTVVLVSGTGGAGDEWTHVVDPATPAAGLKPSAAAVLPTVASFTRVCAYDRPGTTRTDGKPTSSTPVSQPTTARAGVRDLRAVLSAAGEHGPFVLVGASWGAMIAELFARTDFPRVSGLVTVDGASPYLRDTLTPAQWSDWMHKIEATDQGKGLEVPDYEASVAEIGSAPAMPHPLPAVVLTSDKPWDLAIGDSGSTWPAWLAAQDDLARELHARHVTDTDSGHGIAVERPRLVADAVREVVDEARKQ